MRKSLIELIKNCNLNSDFLFGPSKVYSREMLLEKAMDFRNRKDFQNQSSVISGGDFVEALVKIIAFEDYIEQFKILKNGSNNINQLDICTLNLFKKETIWNIETSGTTGNVKLIQHTFQTISEKLKLNVSAGTNLTWCLLYDPFSFAGLQVALQALFGGSRLLVPGNLNNEDLAKFLYLYKCSSISATPSMWRKMISFNAFRSLPLKHVTLGGEIVDQNLLNSLKKIYPDSIITHIYALTEAGVAFSVKDGFAGFPLSYLNKIPGFDSQIEIDNDGCLLVKRKSICNKGSNESGYETINTGDLVEVVGDRVYFRGRKNGSINVGGRKVMPEEIEKIIREVPGIIEAKVQGKRSSIMGSLVVAEIVVQSGIDREYIKNELNNYINHRLESYKRPAIYKIVEAINLNASGKIIRNDLHD